MIIVSGAGRCDLAENIIVQFVVEKSTEKNLMTMTVYAGNAGITS